MQYSRTTKLQKLDRNYGFPGVKDMGEHGAQNMTEEKG